MKYDAEFKRQTIQKVLDGQSVRSVMVKKKWRENSLFFLHF